MTGITYLAVEETWLRLEAEAQALKFAHQAVILFEDFYGGLDDEDRAVANGVLDEWIGLDIDSGRRFVALAVVSRFKVRDLSRSVRAALALLGDEVGPSVPFERSKLERIIEKLQDSC